MSTQYPNGQSSTRPFKSLLRPSLFLWVAHRRASPSSYTSTMANDVDLLQSDLQFFQISRIPFQSLDDLELFQADQAFF
jgi:hypothetical protein